MSGVIGFVFAGVALQIALVGVQLYLVRQSRRLRDANYALLFDMQTMLHAMVARSAASADDGKNDE